MSEKRELFADIFVGVMTGDKDFVQDKLLLLHPEELSHLLQGLEWLKELCEKQVKDALENGELRWFQEKKWGAIRKWQQTTFERWAKQQDEN